MRPSFDKIVEDLRANFDRESDALLAVRVPLHGGVQIAALGNASHFQIAIKHALRHCVERAQDRLNACPCDTCRMSLERMQRALTAMEGH